MRKFWPIFIAFVALLPSAHGLLGYDCGGGNLNLTTISLLDVEECDIPETKVKTENIKIQLLQTIDFKEVEIIECRVEIDRQIHRCGMHSHSSVVANYRRNYLLDLSESLCRDMYHTGSFPLAYNVPVNGLQRNATNHRHVMLGGSLGNDGTCEGTSYSDPFGDWSYVVVDANLYITVNKYMGRVDIKSGMVALRSGHKCNLKDLKCIDGAGYSAFWRDIPADSCPLTKFGVLYEGMATHIIGSAPNPDVYTVTTEDITFALARKVVHDLCGFRVISTEHPKLFIVEGGGAPNDGKVKVDNMDIFTYINSKFVYVERHIRLQMENLYHDILVHRCELERRILMNSLALSSINPDQFSYALMKVPGYYTVIAGEVVHVIKCIGVPVKKRQAEVCYQELPVTYKNESYFLTPKSRTLTKKGTIVECNEFLPIQFDIDGRWYQFLPKVSTAPLPQSLKPETEPSWSYNEPMHLAQSGVYSQEDLEKLRDRIMFPVEREALLNSLARGVTGRSTGDKQISLIGLLDENALNRIAESTAQKIWGGFVEFGSVSAGIMAILMIIKIFKYVADTIIQGKALHETYGCGKEIFGALWNALTSYLLHRHHQRNSQQPNKPEDPPTEVIVNQPISTPPVPPPRQYYSAASRSLYDLRDSGSIGSTSDVLKGVDPVLLSKLRRTHDP
ncbi:uncharacterized protein LOC130664100 [Microplitis mediator]|uniref:uncharacterized protein LOC130663762 n=1 Tax=Microplitis mediator TaxID=375433 RepID=UPI0025557AC5|nr:uncharacterized protein LOC130663762 [Microplitis mediator]XP_057319847.1 uncharacterized protein LOC130664100 [Microplitis mediator]